MSKWTSTPPTEPGWYWWRWAEGAREEVVEVFHGHKGLRAKGTRHEVGYAIPYERLVLGGQWWPVPIPEPGEGENDG